MVFCTDIWLFCPIESHRLYDVVCSALECGSFEVKKVSDVKFIVWLFSNNTAACVLLCG